MKPKDQPSASDPCASAAGRFRSDAIRASQAPCEPPEMDRETLSELNRQLQIRASGLARLHRITLALASTRQPARLLPLVVREAVEMLNASKGVIYLVEPATQRLIPHVAVGADLETFRGLSIELDEGLEVDAAQSRYHRVVFGVRRSPSDGRPVDELRVAVPLIAESRTQGVVVLYRTGSTVLSAIEEELVVLLAGHASQILYNSNLYDELDQSYRELSLLYDVQQEIVSAVGYRSVLSQIAHKLKEIFRAEDCTVRLVDRSGPEPLMRIAASAGRRPMNYQDRLLASSRIDQMVMSGGIVIIRDLLSDPLFTLKQVAVERGFCSMISAPLRARDTIIGTIRVYTGEPRDFTLADQKILSAVAAQAAIAILNANLVHQIEEKNRQLEDSNQQLLETQEALVAKEKLAMLGEMAATVAHEIRNPLTAIRGFAQRISRKVSSDTKTCAYCALIMQEVDRSNRFIKDVLDFARRLHPKLEPIDLNALLRDTLPLLQEELVQHEISMVPLLDLDLPRVNIDATQIKQVLVNLIQNARHSMGREGTLTLATEAQDKWVVLCISDTGAGIPPEVLPRIWEPFFTTRTQGTGLGLSLVRRVMEDHGGRVEVESRPGDGAVFRLYFPIPRTDSAAPES